MRHEIKSVMHRSVIGLFLTAIAVVVVAGCSPVQDPWDNTGHFKQERTRSVELGKTLRERALHGQIDRRTGVQQVNRTS